MNMLNNLIFEGKLTKEVEFTVQENGLKVAKSVVASSRYVITAEGERKEEITNVELECYGRMAEDLERISKTRKNVRIVGRIKNQGDKVIIVAEHIEYKTK